MHVTANAAILTLTLAYSLAAQVDRVPKGTDIVVRTDETINTKYPSDSRIYRGSIERDVLDKTGKVAIRRGSQAELILRDVSDNELVLDLESVIVDGTRYTVDSQSEVVGGTERGRQGVGANKRTGKYVGGGAVLGTIIGAIAGGGTGAAIGAAAGAGAGAVGQTVTKGSNVRLPAESIISFRLERPMIIGAADDGYTRDGYHYHRYERERQQQ